MEEKYINHLSFLPKTDFLKLTPQCLDIVPEKKSIKLGQMGQCKLMYLKYLEVCVKLIMYITLKVPISCPSLYLSFICCLIIDCTLTFLSLCVHSQSMFLLYCGLVP